MSSAIDQNVHTLSYGLKSLNYRQGFYDYWAQMVRLFLKTSRLQVTGLEEIDRVRGAILAPNHLNWKDPFFISGVIHRPVRFVATYRLFDTHLCIEMLDEYASKITHERFWLDGLHKLNQNLARFAVKRIRFSGAIPSRFNTKDYSLIHAMRLYLARKKLVCLFPEGKTSSMSRLNRIKMGLSHFLLDQYHRYHESVPVLPVGITGTDKPISPGMKLSLHIGRPMYINDFIETKPNRTLLQFSNSLRERIYDLMHSGR